MGRHKQVGWTLLMTRTKPESKNHGFQVESASSSTKEIVGRINRHNLTQPSWFLASCSRNVTTMTCRDEVLSVSQ